MSAVCPYMHWPQVTLGQEIHVQNGKGRSTYQKAPPPSNGASSEAPCQLQAACLQKAPMTDSPLRLLASEFHPTPTLITPTLPPPSPPSLHPAPFLCRSHRSGARVGDNNWKKELSSLRLPFVTAWVGVTQPGLGAQCHVVWSVGAQEQLCGFHL